MQNKRLLITVAVLSAVIFCLGLWLLQKPHSASKPVTLNSYLAFVILKSVEK